MKNEVMNNSPQSALLQNLQKLIEGGRNQAVAAVKSTITVTYWRVGKRINDEVLRGQRAEYGKQVVTSLAKDLVLRFGKSSGDKYFYANL